MAGEDYVFDKGASLTPSFGPYATLMEQAIERATPNSYRGMVIRSATPPAIVGQPTGYPSNWYAFQARSVWVNNSGEAYWHDGTTWSLIRAKAAALSVTNDLVADNAIRIGKLSAYGSTAGQLIRATVGGTFEYVDAINTISPNTLPVDRLASPSTSVTSILRSVSSTKSWVTFDSAFVVGVISDNAVPVNKLVRGAALQVPMVAADGNSVAWNSVLAGIPDNSIGFSKIEKNVAYAGKNVEFDSTGQLVAAAKVTPTLITKTVKEILALPAAGASVSVAHDITIGAPDDFMPQLVCVTADAGYTPGDVIKLSDVTLATFSNAYLARMDSTNITLIRRNDAAGLTIINGSTRNDHPFVPANWKFRVVTVKYP